MKVGLTVCLFVAQICSAKNIRGVISMDEKQNEKCKGHSQCERNQFSDGFCQFHLPNDHEKALTCGEYDALLVKEVEEAIENKKGIYALYWDGFIFPKKHVLFDPVKFSSVKDRLAKSWISIQDSNIQNIFLINSIYQLILSNATIHKKTTISVVEIDYLSMHEANVMGEFHCASKTRMFDARGARFYNGFSFAATISEAAIFYNSYFQKSCVFRGYNGMVFGSDALSSNFKSVSFDSAVFGSPAEVLFQDVDLRKASFKSVSLMGVRFNATNFYQSDLGRNGLYNEIKQFNPNAGMIYFGRNKLNKNDLKKLNHLVHEYRQLRRCMESNKNHMKANGFYIGEIEAQQKLEWSVVLAIYQSSSSCGTNFIRAFVVLLILFSIHFCITVLLSTNLQVQKLFCGPEIVAAWGRLSDLAIHSLSTGTLQRIGLLNDLSHWQKIPDMLFRILIPIQSAMFVLALRNMIKR